MKSEQPKRNLLFPAIRLFSLLGLSLLTLPFLLPYFLLFPFDAPVQSLMLMQLLCTVLCFVGVGASALSQRFSHRFSWMGDLLTTLLGICIAIAGSFLIPQWFTISDWSMVPSWILSIPGFFLIFPWILGTRAQGKIYSDLLNRGSMTCYMVTSLIGSILFWWNHRESPLLFYGVGLLALAAAFGLSRNQGNLDFLMARRGHDFASLPARIRYYNVRLLAVLLVILCAAAIFIRPITSGCLALLEIIKNLLGGLIGLLLSIFSSSGGQSEAQQPQSTPTPTPILEGTSWAGWQILTFLIVLAAVVVLLFNLKKILIALLRVFRNLLERLAALFSREQFGGRYDGESEYYVDEDVALKPEVSGDNLLSERQKRRLWRKQKRRFQRMEDSPEKLLLGYELAVQAMKMKPPKFSLKNSDTPLEIAEKAAKSLRSPGIFRITDDYNANAYGGAERTSALPQLRQMLDELEQDKG